MVYWFNRIGQRGDSLRCPSRVCTWLPSLFDYVNDIYRCSQIFDFYLFADDTNLLCNISKTSASVSSGVPNTEKQMKARGRRPSAFIVSRCLEPLKKHEARVFEMASQTSVKISWNFFPEE